jgi:hypothetical protein
MEEGYEGTIYRAYMTFLEAILEFVLRYDSRYC